MYDENEYCDCLVDMINQGARMYGCTQVVTVQCERAKGECKKLAKEYEVARRQVNIVGVNQ